MFVVAAGNPFEGISLFVSDTNQPFNTEAEAQAFGEQHFFDFQIIPLFTSEMMAEDDEDDEECDIISIRPVLCLANQEQSCAKSSRKSHIS